MWNGRMLAGAALSLMVTAAAAAQQPEERRPQGRPGLVSQERLGPSAAGIVRGRVATTTGAPIRGAEVRVRYEDGRDHRFATTDGDGYYEIRDLLPGSYSVTASKSGFLHQQHGQRRAFDAPETITLTERGDVTANFALARAGAIAGRVFNEFAEPVAGARVQVYRMQVVRGVRQPRQVGLADETDDTGSFRVYALPPGEYYVGVNARGAAGWMGGTPFGMTTYYPGTPHLMEAHPIRLAAADDYAGVVVQLGAVRGVRVTGRILNSQGLPVTDAQVALLSGSDPMAPAVGTGLTGDVDATGQFTISGVPPGSYMLRATTMGNGQGMSAMETVVTPVNVGAEDVRNVVATTLKSGRLTVHFAAAPGSGPLPENMTISVGVRSVMGMSMNMGGRLTPERRTYELDHGITGPSALGIERLPDEWMVQSIEVNGIDVTDTTFELPSAAAGTARVYLTDRVTSLTGSVRSSRGDAEPDAHVIIFAEQRARWGFGTRHIHAVPTDAQGRFTLRKLPPGERYLAIAVDYLEPEEQLDPSFLEWAAERATAFTMGEGEQKSINLSLVSR